MGHTARSRVVMITLRMPNIRTHTAEVTRVSILLYLIVNLLNLDVTGPEDCGTVTPAYVISTSYGYNEADLTPFYAERQCAEYAKLGMMGVTVLYSSGDDGVAGNGNYCLNPNGMP
jgi:subtilase family serine protease